MSGVIFIYNIGKKRPHVKNHELKAKKKKLHVKNNLKFKKLIDLFRLYVLFSQYKSCDNIQEDWFVVLLIKKNACKHEYVCMHSF